MALLVSSFIFLAISSFLRPELPSFEELFLAALAGSFVGIGLLSFTKSMETTDLSVVSPLQQTIPVFASVIEPLVLSELGYSLEVIIAAILTTIGAYIIVINPDELLLPLKKLRRRGPIMALLTAFLFGMSSVIAHYTTQSMPVIYYLLVEVSTGFTVLTLIRGSLPDFDPKLVAYGSLFTLNLGFSILTLSLVVASKATVFFRLSLVINVLIGLWLLGEENMIVRIVGSIIIISGVVLTSV